MKRISRTIPVILLCAVCVLMTALTALAAHDDDGYGRRTLTGVVTDIDSPSLELTVRFDERGTYTVRADEAIVQMGSRELKFRDIREGDHLKITGDLRSGKIMDAYTIRILTGDGRDDDSYDRGAGWETGKVLTVSGEVESVDSVRGLVRLASEVGQVDILVERRTDIREWGRKKTFDDIRDGDHLVVTGKVESYSRLTAHSINIGGPDSRGGSNNLQTIVMGEVVRNSDAWDRNLTVRTPVGEVTMAVPREAKVIRNGDYISVHEIDRGDIVRALGTWRGNTFTANQIDVTTGGSSRDRDRYFGRIEHINYDRREFKLKVGRDEYTVKARDAEIVDSGDRLSFRELKNGQDVWTSGDRRGDTIYADRIDRGSYYYKNRESKEREPDSY